MLHGWLLTSCNRVTLKYAFVLYITLFYRQKTGAKKINKKKQKKIHKIQYMCVYVQEKASWTVKWQPNRL